MAAAFCATLGLDRPELLKTTIAVLEHGSADSSFVLSCIMWEWLTGRPTRACKAVGTLLPRSSDPTSAVLLISSHHSLTHFRMQCLKLGLNLPSFTQKGSFQSLDLMHLISDTLHSSGAESDIFERHSGGVILKNLYLRIRKYVLQMIEKFQSVCLIIGNIDDVLHVGGTMSEVFVFLNYLKGLMFEMDGLSLVISAHVSKYEEHDGTLEAFLKHMSNVSLNVSALSTGLCKDISGSISFMSDFSSSCEYHYRLLDRQVKIFAPGTS